MAKSIYKTPEGEAEILALYDEALAGLGPGHESLTVGTRLGDTHVIAFGPEGAPPAVFLPGGNALNPTCLKWFLPLAERHRLYAPDIVGQPGLSAQTRPSPKGDGHAFWTEDVLDGLGLERAPLVGISYGAAIAIRTMGLAPERVCRAALVSPAGIAAVPFLRVLLEIGAPTLLYRLRPTEEHLMRVAKTVYTEPENPAFGPAVRQLGAALRHLRLDADLPRTATEEELAGFGGPVAVFASEEDALFPARAVLPRAKEIFPNLALAEFLEDCRHVPSNAALGRVNKRVLAFLACPDENQQRSQVALRDVPREVLAALIKDSRVELGVEAHRAAHAETGDFARWGRLGGLETFGLYGPGWFVLLARRRWEKITAAQLEEAFAVIRTGRS